MKTIKLICLGMISAWLLLSLAGCMIQRAFVWPMSAEEVVDRPVPPGAELVWVGDENQRVEGWFFPAQKSAENSKRPAVIFFHGNNELIDHCLEFAERYTANGMSTLLVEYRGYGRSTGIPAMAAVRSDMVQFFDWLASRPEVDATRIVFHGRSIGGAVAADLSKYREPAAMILASTFTSMEVMFWRFGIPGFLVQDKYRTQDVMEQVGFPVLVMHGARDNIIPVSDGRELGASGAKTTYVEYDSNHDLPTQWIPFEEDILRFLQRSNIIADVKPELDLMSRGM